MCNQENIFDEEGKQILETYFVNNCKDKESCVIDFDLESLIKQECKDRMTTVASDQFVMMVECMKDYITLFGGEYHKLVVAWIVVIFDMISICLIMYFIIKL
jgi:hypothetical protein